MACGLTGVAQAGSIADDLVAYWSFDGHFNDTGPGANHAIGVGDPGFTQGKFGQAVTLDGLTQYVEVPADDSLDMRHDQTVSLWFRTTEPNWSDEGRFRFESFLLATGNYPSNGFQIQIRNLGAVEYRTSDNDTGFARWVSNGRSNTNNGQWIHIVGVFDLMDRYQNSFSYNSELRLYTDGNKRTNFTEWGIFGTTATDEPHYMGGFPSAVGSHNWMFDGEIDEVAMWDRVLSDDEIAALGQQPLSELMVPAPLAVVVIPGMAFFAMMRRR